MHDWMETRDYRSQVLNLADSPSEPSARSVGWPAVGSRYAPARHRRQHEGIRRQPLTAAVELAPAVPGQVGRRDKVSEHRPDPHLMFGCEPDGQAGRQTAGRQPGFHGETQVEVERLGKNMEMKT